jgi:hypothetical protein
MRPEISRGQYYVNTLRISQGCIPFYSTWLIRTIFTSVAAAPPSLAKIYFGHYTVTLFAHIIIYTLGEAIIVPITIIDKK